MLGFLDFDCFCFPSLQRNSDTAFGCLSLNCPCNVLLFTGYKFCFCLLIVISLCYVAAAEREAANAAERAERKLQQRDKVSY